MLNVCRSATDSRWLFHQPRAAGTLRCLFLSVGRRKKREWYFWRVALTGATEEPRAFCAQAGSFFLVRFCCGADASPGTPDCAAGTVEFVDRAGLASACSRVERKLSCRSVLAALEFPPPQPGGVRGQHSCFGSAPVKLRPLPGKSLSPYGIARDRVEGKPLPGDCPIMAIFEGCRVGRRHIHKLVRQGKEGPATSMTRKSGLPCVRQQGRTCGLQGPRS